MFKFKRDIGAAGAAVVTIIILAGVAVSIFTYKGAIATADIGTEGTYEAYETLTGQEITRPNKSEPSGGTGGGGDAGSIPPVVPGEGQTPLGNIIPAGATYTAADGVVYNAGDEFPEEPATGDIYICNGYEYRYNSSCFFFVSNLVWQEDESLKKWGVRVVDSTLEEYAPLEESICGKSLYLRTTYARCENIKTLDWLTIPYGVESLNNTFARCTGLVDASGLKIPSSVVDMFASFSGCENLKKAPQIHYGVTSTSSMFKYCESIETAPTTPDSVVSMNDMFFGCSKLVTVPNISANAQEMQFLFRDCTSLVTVPAIPNTANDIQYAFMGCTALTGEVEINANNTTIYKGLFEGTILPITLTGSISNTLKSDLAATANNGNVTY